MSVAAHLGIRLGQYDRRIRTFIPHYLEMLDVVAGVLQCALGHRTRLTIVDLGVGTGMLAARCLDAVPQAKLVGIDVDPTMLPAAAKRLSGRAQSIALIAGDFVSTPLPRADAIIASLALHHIRTPASKRALYRRCAAALKPGGLLVSADRQLSGAFALQEQERETWITHLRRSYSAKEAKRFLDAWALEDTYMTLDQEVALLHDGKLRADVVWRRDGFAVIAAWKTARRA